MFLTIDEWNKRVKDLRRAKCRRRLVAKGCIKCKNSFVSEQYAPPLESMRDWRWARGGVELDDSEMDPTTGPWFAHVLCERCRRIEWTKDELRSEEVTQGGRK